MMKLLYNTYLSIVMFLLVLPNIIRKEVGLLDALRLIRERWEHMDSSLNMYNGYRRAFHYNRYIFANNYNYKKTDLILDIACGFGYWTEFLAKKNKAVCWVDLSAFSIRYAKKYHNKSNIKYLEWDASNVKIKTKFNKIVSFETIEHLPTDKIVDAYLTNIRDHLKDWWLFFCSSPNKWWLTKYHFQDYNYSEFKNKLEENWFIIKTSYKQNSWDLKNKNNHDQIWWIFEIQNDYDKNTAEVLIFVCEKS